MAVREADALTQEAADWFARLKSAHVPPQDRQAFEAWIEADPARAVAYARVEATWERAGRLAAFDQAASEGRMIPRKPLITRRIAAGLIAAGGLGAAGAGGAFVASRRSETFVTAVGQRRTVVLADGSTVMMNTATRLAVAYRADRRDMRLLAGEASFEVAHDPGRPFVVSAGKAAVRAVGTVFNVRLRGDLAEVTVTEGVVAISERVAGRRPETPAKSAPRIRAGGGAVAGGGALARVALDEDALQTRTAWRQGLIEFRGETLEQAAAEFNRYSDRKLLIGDPRVASIRVGGTFGTGEADKFVGALEAGFGIRAVPGDGGATYLLPAG